MFSGTAAAAAVGATGGSGLWLFSYNKENYGNDTGQRFGRFMMARGNANAQVGQYREDIEGIVGATVSKMDAWQTVTTLFLAVGAALSCAGRVGMHGCAPPGWFCALFSGSIFMSVMFNGVSLWFSMHGALRAQCASVSLLTRKVRLPIPSMGQLDQARVFGSGFEKQPVRDIFRVPFQRHPNAAPDMPFVEGEGAAKKGKRAAHDPTKEFGSTARDTVPTWIRDEVVVDKGEGFMGTEGSPVHDPLEAPEHFQLLMKAQEEWRDYDVYARISMLYGVVSFLYAVTYYAVGTAIAELRGFWVMWSIPMVFMAAQALIMRLDILRTSTHILPHAEWLGHLAPYFAVTACTLEYRYFYSEASVTAAWGFALLALFAHFVMALRMLDLAWPAGQKADMPEEPGKQWWPGSWRVPSAFTKHLWFITPPKKLDPAVSPCLLHEMDDMAKHGGGMELRRRKGPGGKVQHASTAEATAGVVGEDGSSPYQEMGFKRGNDLPWQMMRICILTAAFQWFFVMITTGAEVILGPESLLKPPGEPPWIRDTKYRHFTPDMVHHSTDGALPKDYRLFSASRARYTDADADQHATAPHGPAQEHGAADHVGADHGGHHRRLAAEDGAIEQLLQLMPQVGEFADKVVAGGVIERPSSTSILPSPVPPVAFMAGGPKIQRVQWPALFQPAHLLCSPKQATKQGMVALTRRGVGAIVPFSDQGGEAERFSLGGVSEHGPLAGGAWTQRGLELVSTSGRFLQCDGHSHSAGTWACRLAEHPSLPLAKGAELLAAALGEPNGGDGYLVALVLKSLPHIAAIFRNTGGAWHPEHEVHLPPQGGRPGLSFDGHDLLVTLSDGEVHRRPAIRKSRGELAVHGTTTASDGVARDFCSACATAKGKMMRLALRQGQANAWVPEIVTLF